jgi:hypothetical protein
MHIGVQLHAPEGWGILESGVTYHYLGNDKKNERVFFIVFKPRVPPSPIELSELDTPAQPGYKQNTEYTPCMIRLQRADLEAGLEAECIKKNCVQKTMPPWLEGLGGINFNEIDADNRTAKLSLHERVVARLLQIQPLVKTLDNLLEDSDPELRINQYARTHRLNAPRVRLWLFTYVLFGMNMWVLLQRFCANGHWLRPTKAGVKRGRPSRRKGKNSGFNADTMMIEKIHNGFRQFAKRKVSMRKIYERTLMEVFGCKVKTDTDRKRHFYHPDGLPFPTENQFLYHVKKKHSNEVIGIAKYGDKRYREMRFASSGSFTNNVALLYQRVEADGYYTGDHCRGITMDHVLPKLCVVRAVDAVSGLLLGVGFTLGAETAAAYNSRLFCMAIDKVKFCSLFGIEIDFGDWPGAAIASEMVVDRGPASGARFLQAKQITYR